MDNQLSRPANDSWVAAVHRTETDDVSLGSAFVLDTHRVLSCAHVVRSASEAGAPLWVAFPKAEDGDTARIAVREVVLPPPGVQRTQDTAILRLAEQVPTTRVPRLRCPVPADMVGRDWWAFGFPGGEPLGNSAAGVIGEALGYGWVRLDTNSRYTVKSGFSGSALWSPEYDAVVGVVGQASGEGDARALSLWQIDRIFPGEGIADLAVWTVEAAGESALASWGWSLREDPEAGRHWRPRARGVSIETERGFRFRGRTAALTAIVDWISDPPQRKALVVTGSPGVGKSAVLGRVVTTADEEIAGLLPVDDTGVRAQVGSISCAVHAKGKTALDVAVEIAAAASAALPHDIEYLPEYLRDALEERFPPQHNTIPEPFTVVIDALDEAATPQQARLIIRRIIAPLVETCADLNIRVMVGSRRRDDSGDLLASFGRTISVIDLDEPHYFEAEDLTSYTLATLQMLGDERQDTPYADDAIAEPVARRIAAMAERNFLVAGLVARAHGLHDQDAVRPEQIAFIPTVDGALRDYLDRIQPVDGHPADAVLAALAFAEAPGFSLALWRTAIIALGGPDIPAASLAAFARSSAANFLVESGGGQQQDIVYRLFHQALNDTLISARAELHSPCADERALSRALIAEGERTGWTEADAYLKRSLPGHAEAGDVLDELLSMETYLLHADLRRLLPVADRASSDLARSRTKLIRRTPLAFNADPSQRIALFSVTEAQQHLGRVYRDLALPAPYRATWSTVLPGSEEAVLDGHTRGSYVLCAFTLGDRDLLASAGGDRTVRIWDPVLGEALHVMEGHTDEVRSIVPVRLGTLDALASAGRDGTIRFWDPLVGEPLHHIEGNQTGYSALCSLTRDGRVLLAAARATEVWPTIQLIDSATGQQVAELEGHEGWITALCEVTVDDATMLASCSEDGAICLWDLSTKSTRWVVTRAGWDEWTRALCTVRINGQTLIVGAGYDSVIRLWDPGDGAEVGQLRGHEASVFAVCVTTLNEKPVLVSGGADETLRLWDPHAGQQLAMWLGHTDSIYAVCSVRTGSQVRLASSGDDRTIRVWDPATGGQETLAEGSEEHDFNVACAVRTGSGLFMATTRVGRRRVVIRDPISWEKVRELTTTWVNAMCTVQFQGRSHLVVAGTGIEIWDPQTGNRVRFLQQVRQPYMGVNSISAVKVNESRLLVVSSASSVHFWDISRGRVVHEFDVGSAGAREICLVPVRERLAIAGVTYDGRIRIWDPRTGNQLAELSIGRGSLTAQCTVQVGGRVLLATGNEFGVVQFWDPATGKLLSSLEGHAAAVRQLWVSVVDGHKVLVSSSDDRTLRIWDPTGLRPLVEIPVHYTIEWVAQAGSDITVSLDTGMLGVRLDLSTTGLCPTCPSGSHISGKCTSGHRTAGQVPSERGKLVPTHSAVPRLPIP
ncbi:trypsin-like peptidase domain-containing protein [Streptomyces sp. NPDC057623]|uniref:trypsin-like peptidase domain-containing protein n=1 Tax=Streptomyces sp. NPDC057623 TaxID=3346187 RepID=UPI0036C4C48B